MCNHGIEHLSLQGHSVISQHDKVVFDVLSNFERIGIFEGRFKYIHNCKGFFTIGRYRYIKSLVFGKTEAHSHQFCRDGIDSGGFRV